MSCVLTNIRWMATYPAGGGTEDLDTMCRVFSTEKLSRRPSDAADLIRPLHPPIFLAAQRRFRHNRRNETMQPRSICFLLNIKPPCLNRWQGSTRNFTVSPHYKERIMITPISGKEFL